MVRYPPFLRSSVLLYALVYILVFGLFFGLGGAVALGEEVDFRIGETIVSLTLADEVTEVTEDIEKYDRDNWSHWDGHVDGGCFNVRDQVLADETYMPVETRPASGGRCLVVSGLWFDPYTGMTFTNSQDVEIDHVVALNEAHQSGGWNWDNARRRDYANYLADPFHLIAVYKVENGRSRKSDKDPSDYMPLNTAFHCAYIGAWISIKDRWDLTVDAAEVTAIRRVIAAASCS